MTTRALVFALSLALPLGTASLRAEDWTTADGKTYREVSVVRTEPDAVTILHHDGGARVPLKKLPSELQQRFHFDPAKADLFAFARALAEKISNQALQAEMDQVAARKQAALIAQNPNPPLPPVPENTTAPSATVANNDPTHHGIGELVDTKKRLRDDHDDDTNHYSMGALKRASQSLLTDTDNSNHHAQGDLFHSGSNLP